MNTVEEYYQQIIIPALIAAEKVAPSYNELTDQLKGKVMDGYMFYKLVEEGDKLTASLKAEEPKPKYVSTLENFLKSKLQ